MCYNETRKEVIQIFQQAIKVLTILDQRGIMSPEDVALYLHVSDCDDLVPAFSYLESHNLISRSNHLNDPPGIAPDYRYMITAEGHYALLRELSTLRKHRLEQLRDILTLFFALVSAITGIISLFR